MNGATSTPCLICRTEYETGPRRASRFCLPCRTARRQRVATTTRLERAAADRAARADRRQIVDSYVMGGMDPEFAESRLFAPLEEMFSELDEDPPVVTDRMPSGAYTPRGPKDGTSTYFPDLADDLDARHREAASDDWWAANPHAMYGVNGGGELELVDLVLSWSDPPDVADMSAA